MADDLRRDAIAENLTRSRIAGDLMDQLSGTGKRTKATRTIVSDDRVPVIIEGNSAMPQGAGQARRLIALAYARAQPVGQDPAIAPDTDWIARLTRPEDPVLGDTLLQGLFDPRDEIHLEKSLWTDYYLFGCLTPATVERLSATSIDIPSALDRQQHAVPLVHKLWLNHAIETHVYESIRTVKCDAARAAFAAAGDKIIWAVADTGVDRNHPHFQTHATLDLPDGLQHHDFTDGPSDALLDEAGHGTHVAGIIAGETKLGSLAGPQPGTAVTGLVIAKTVRASDTQIVAETDTSREMIAGVAPLCKLVSLKVLRQSGDGDVGNLLAAIGYIQKANDYGANLRIHGVNMSLGYSFDARWFAAGRSPLCVEVDRLVRSGVVVVVAAGNSGYGPIQTLNREVDQASHLASISDPGNAELAITVGSTHRDEPHNFGVSYFSAKGPTADGRAKPDLVAPGERIVSAAPYDTANPGLAPYRQDSGTSMAAPHVSGCIAAFLSVRREYRGEPDKIKTIFMNSATDLGRRADFQGAGLIDVMRALQSV